ncbi:universal stress protein [Nonomuraea sp. NPDC050643]|uniref:universal stress protein n=1 Tax=Nonomuraea sp. NPDC050643 TaxID=3155660 RepID=UPI0033EF27F8
MPRRGGPLLLVLPATVENTRTRLIRAARLLVVGVHGLGEARGLLLGSVSQAMAHRASCPVSVVHASEGVSDPRLMIVREGQEDLVRQGLSLDVVNRMLGVGGPYPAVVPYVACEGRTDHADHDRSRQPRAVRTDHHSRPGTG